MGKLFEHLVVVGVFHRASLFQQSRGSHVEHPQRLLQGFLKRFADGHDFSHRFHAGTQFAVDHVEFVEVPARHFHHHVIEGGLETGHGRSGYGVFQFGEAVAEGQFGGDERQGVTRGFGSQSRTAGKAGVHFDDPVVVGARIERVLDVALADDPQVPDHPQRYPAQQVVLFVAERLAGSDHDRFPRVDAEGIEIFHVANRDAVVEGVLHHFVFHLLPSPQVFFDENLVGVAERFAGQLFELLPTGTDSGTQSSQGVGDADDDGEADFPRAFPGLFDVGGASAPGGVDPDGAQNLGEFPPVFRGADHLDRGSHHPHPVLFQHAAPVKLDPAVQRRLSAERQENSLGLFSFDDPFDHLRGDRQQIDFIGQPGAGLDRGDVGVDQHHLHVFFLEGLDRLAAGVVEFARLADFEGGAAEQHDFADGGV